MTDPSTLSRALRLLSRQCRGEYPSAAAVLLTLAGAVLAGTEASLADAVRPEPAREKT